MSGTGSLTALAPLGFGCAQLFRLHSARERQAVLAAAYEAGIRHFDVAPLYGLGQAEIELGQFLRGRRDTVTVTTKFGLDPAAGMSAVRVVQGMARRLVDALPSVKRYLQSRRRPLAARQSFDPKAAQRSLERSLRRLATEHIDYFLLHEPTADLVDRDSPTDFLQQQKKRGLIRAFGIAGPVEPLAAVIARHPALAEVVQHPGPQLGEQNDALPQPPFGQSFIYGSVGPRLQAIKTMLAANAEAGEEWRRRPGHVCDRSLASLLLLDQRMASSSSTILVGSAKPAHVSEVARAISPQDQVDVMRLREMARAATKTGMN